MLGLNNYKYINEILKDRAKQVLLLVLLLCITPFILNLLNFDFSSQITPLKHNSFNQRVTNTDDLFYAVAGGLHHALLEWSAVTIAVLAAISSFIHYLIRKDISVPIIGLAVLSAGMVDAFHTLAATRIIQASSANIDFIPFTWGISRTFNASIMIFGILVSIWLTDESKKIDENKQFKIFIIIVGLFLGVAYIIVHYAAVSQSLPKMMYINAIIKRPFDALPLVMFILGGTLVWYWFKQSKSIIRWALLLSILAEITTQLHMVFGSTALFDNHFNIAHFLKIMAYAIIFIGVLMDLTKALPKQLHRQHHQEKIISSEADKHQKQTPIQLNMLLDIGVVKRPLSLKIPIAAFILSLVISSTVGFVFYKETTRVAVENNYRFLEHKNAQTKAVISTMYKEFYDHITFISHFPSLQKINSHNLVNYSEELSDFTTLSKNFLKTRAIYTAVKVVDYENKSDLVSVVKNVNKIHSVKPEQLNHYNKTPYTEGVNSIIDGHIFFSEVVMRTKSNGKKGDFNVFDVAIPINDDSGQIKLLVILEIHFGRFMQIVRRLSLDDIDMYLFNEQGNILYNPNVKLNEINKTLSNYSLSSLFENTKNKSSQFYLFESVRPNDKNKLTTSLYQEFQFNQFGEGQKFKWVIQSSNDYFVDSLKEIEIRSILIGFSLSFIALALSLIAARKFILPLTKMIRSVSNESGELVLNDLPISENDEIGMLARSFYNLQVLKNFKNEQVEEHQYALDQHAIVSASDIEGNILFVNSKFEEISGYEKNELLGKNHRLLNSRTHNKEFFETMYLNLTKGIVWRGEICNKNKKGELYWVNTTIVPLLNKEGDVYQYISIRNEITEQKFAEQELTKAIVKTEKAVQSKSEFFASMSHEIRTPMNGVLGMLRLMMRTDLNKQQIHYATLARSSADSLLTIIDDILDLSKIDAGKIELELIEFNLREQLEIFAESMAYRAQDKGLEVILDVKDVEESSVIGDPSRLRQILSNLVGNAIKFTETGEIQIKASLKHYDEKEWLFYCEIIDTGMGIPSDKIDLLFDSYSQVDSTTTRKFGGTGLGLAIVKQLSALMNGKVDVKSIEGQGTSFIFEIRLAKSKHSDKVLPEYKISGKYILVVDDNLTNSNVLARQLNYWGATVDTVVSGLQAIELLRRKYEEKEKYFDMILIDMNMPVMDGTELGKIIRENNHYKKIKMVMMTSMEGSSDISKFKHIGFSAYFPKPATTSDLFHALNVLNENKNDWQVKSGQEESQILAGVNVFSNAHILLVEDNPINQAVAKGILEDMGITVDIAENGKEAIKKLQDVTSNYGLILMDCQMPIMDGYEATIAIRSSKNEVKNSKIPIIAMTANALKGDREHCLQVGMDDYLSKPVDPNALEEKLRSWLPKNQQDHHLHLEKNNLMTEIKTKFESHIILSDNVELTNKTELTNVTELNNDTSSEIDAGNKNMSEPNNPVWDKKALMGRVRNNKKLAGKLVVLFVNDLPNLLEQLKEAVKNELLDDITAHSHRIKGSASNLSAVAVASVAASIEKNSRAKNLDLVRAEIDDFEFEVQALLSELRIYIETI